MAHDANATGTQEAGTPAENTASATAASGTPSTGAGQGTGSGAAGTRDTSSAAGTPAAGASGADTGKKVYTYEEDRSTWAPPHRMRETTAKARQLEAELNVMRRQMAALTGVEVPKAEDNDPESKAIKEQFYKLFPWAKKLEAHADKLEKLAGLDPDELSAPNQHYWTLLGQQTLRTLVEQAQESLGGELTPFARRTLSTSFMSWLESDDELALRYSQQDPALVTDFLKEYRNGILDPYRRRSTTATAPGNPQRRVMPRQGAAGVVAGQAPNRPKLGDANYEDAIHDAGWAQLQSGA